MYKVELTEKEIREIGVNRHMKTRGKWRVVTFVVGMFAVVVGACYWDYTLGKVWMLTAGTIWVAYTLYLGRREGKAGVKFLEEIKNAKGNN